MGIIKPWELKIFKEEADKVFDRSDEPIQREVLKLKRQKGKTIRQGDIIRFTVIDRNGNEIKDHPLNKKWYEVTATIRDFEAVTTIYDAYTLKPEEEMNNQQSRKENK